MSGVGMFEGVCLTKRVDEFGVCCAMRDLGVKFFR